MRYSPYTRKTSMTTTKFSRGPPWWLGLEHLERRQCKVKQEMIPLDVKRNLFCHKDSWAVEKGPWEVVPSLSLEAFKNRLGKAWATCSDLIADLALCRRFNWRSPGILSNLNYPTVCRITDLEHLLDKSLQWKPVMYLCLWFQKCTYFNTGKRLNFLKDVLRLVSLKPDSLIGLRSDCHAGCLNRPDTAFAFGLVWSDP